MITVSQVADALRHLNAKWIHQPFGDSLLLRGGAFDTRALKDSQIFFALRSASGDGHHHLNKLTQPIQLLVVEDHNAVPNHFEGAVVQVADTLQALAAVGAAQVKRYRPKVVAITGSYGKTTTKEVVACAIEVEKTVLKSPGSWNNEIGIPMTLLNLDGSQEVAVLEFSARKPGDIAYLCNIAPPDISILTVVGSAHIGVFGSIEQIYQTKAEIFDRLSDHGLALVYSGDTRLKTFASGHRTLTFGEQGNFWADQLTLAQTGHQCFEAVHEARRIPLKSSIPGPYGYLPLLVAWGVAQELNIDVKKALLQAQHTLPQKGRLVIKHTNNDATIIDDTYNASPETVVLLAKTLLARQELKKLLVLGPLRELGDDLTESALLMASVLCEPLSACVVFDPLNEGLAALLQENGAQIPIINIQDSFALYELLEQWDEADTVIGIKGARSSHMERAVLKQTGHAVHCDKMPCGLLIYCEQCPQLNKLP